MKKNNLRCELSIKYLTLRSNLKAFNYHLSLV